MIYLAKIERHTIPCRVCAGDTKVTDTRLMQDGEFIALSRKRVCTRDKTHRFSTIEIATNDVDECFNDKKFNLRLLARSVLKQEIDRFCVWVSDKYGVSNGRTAKD